MRLSNEKIVNDSAVLARMANRELPVKVSYSIAKNLKKLESELKIYNAEKNKLIEKYSNKDEQGKTIVDENNHVIIQEGHIDDWNKEIEELLAIENEIEIHKFSIDDLSGYNITPSELMTIDYMIDED
jgi:hypothetical protein